MPRRDEVIRLARDLRIRAQVIQLRDSALARVRRIPVVERGAPGRLAFAPGLRALSLRPGKQGYSAQAISLCLTVIACGDIAADLISALATGTHLVITATDQIRPIATTTAILTIPVRICITSARSECARPKTTIGQQAARTVA
jgi:hypothetical protein